MDRERAFTEAARDGAQDLARRTEGIATRVASVARASGFTPEASVILAERETKRALRQPITGPRDYQCKPRANDLARQQLRLREVVERATADADLLRAARLKLEALERAYAQSPSRDLKRTIRAARHSLGF